MTTIIIRGHKWGDHPHCLSAYAIFQHNIHSHFTFTHIYVERDSPLTFSILVLLTILYEMGETNSIILQTESTASTSLGFSLFDEEPY